MAFESTMWTLIGKARDGSREALEEVLQQYRYPLLAYLKGRGIADHDAEDIAQEVFLQVCDEDFLKKADKKKGRFRTLLLRVTQHILLSDLRKQYSKKRGSGRRAISIEELADVDIPAVDEVRWNNLWAKNMLRMALDKLQADGARLKAPYHKVLVLRYLEGLSNPEIAAQIGCKPHDIENYIYQGKERVRKYLRELAAQYSFSGDEHAEEVEFLTKYSL